MANAFTSKVSTTTGKIFGTVSIWNVPLSHAGTEAEKNSNLTRGDLQLIETIKRKRPTLSLREIYDGLTESGDIPKGTSRSEISRALDNILQSSLLTK